MTWSPIHLMNSMRTASLALMRAQAEAAENPALEDLLDPGAIAMSDEIQAIGERVATVLGRVMALAVESAGSAVTEPPMPLSPGPEWFDFLDIRSKAIRAMLDRGCDPSDILRMLNIRDENHIHAIAITTGAKSAPRT